MKVNSDRFAVVALVIDQHPAIGENHIAQKHAHRRVTSFRGR